MKSIKYPKSGTQNPKVELLVYNIEEGSAYKSPIDHLKSHDSILITEVKWIGNNNLITKVTDRFSDTLDIISINMKTQKTNIVRSESSNGSWWEITHKTMHIPKDINRGRYHNGYVDLMPVNGYNHLVYFPSITATKPIILTNGTWEVVSGPIAFDNNLERIYF